MSQSVTASGPTVLSANYLGMNLQGVSYYSGEYPFINLFKQAGTNYNQWSGFDTAPTAGQWGDVQWDANGYPTSLTGISGQLFTSVGTNIFTNTFDAPGQTSKYPPGPWTFSFTGIGTIQLGADVTSLSSISNTGSGTSTYSGTTITSPTTGTTTVTFSPNQGGGGVRFTITAIPDAANNPRNFVVLESSNVTAYNAGAVFRPTFLASLTNISRIRFMDWANSNGQTPRLFFGTQVNSGATSATMQTYNYSSNAWNAAPWQLPTGNYLITFKNHQQILCGCVWNSATLTIPGGLSSAVTFDGTQYNAQAWFQFIKDWSSRAKPTDAVYSSAKGVPYEICLELCNELNGGNGVDAWLCYPASVGTVTGADMTYVNGLANLAYNGAGSLLSQFSTGLKKKAYLEYSNECWNSSFPQYSYINAVAAAFFPSAASDEAPAEFRGVMQAQFADAWYAIYGATAFNAGVVSTVGGQTAWDAAGGASSWGIYYTIRAMNTTDWTSRAYTHHITAMHFAPYIGTDGFSTADRATILAQADPVAEIFALMYSNTYQGRTYTSVPTEGWVTAGVTVMNGLHAGFSAQPWANYPLLGYESGTGLDPQADGTWETLQAQCHRDARMEFVYFDPTQQMYNTYGVASANGKSGYLPLLYTVMQSMNQFNDCSPVAKYGEWGALESIMQPFSPLSIAPSKYRGLQKFAIGSAPVAGGPSSGTLTSAQSQSVTASGSAGAAPAMNVNAFKFNPSDYMMQSSTYGTPLATNQAEIDELKLYPVDGYGMSINWGAEVGINYNNPSNILQQYPGFQHIADVFNYLQSKIPGARMVLYVDYAVYNPGAFTQAKLTTSNWGNNYAIPSWIANCGGSLVVPNSYGSGSSTTYQVARIYPTSPYYGLAWSQWSTSTLEYFASYPAVWNRGINQARINFVEALSQYTFTVTSGPLSGQTLGINANPYIELLLNNDETSWDFRSNPSSGQMFNPPGYVNAADRATPANFWAAQLLYYKKLQQFFPNTQVVTCESFGFGGDGGASSNPDQAAFVNDYFRQGGLSGIEGFSNTPGIALSCADQYGADFSPGVHSFANSAKCGFLGINGAPATRPFQLPSPSVASLVGKAVNVAQYQPTDYSGYLPTGVAAYSAAAIQALIASAAYLRSPYRIWSKTDNRFISTSWRTYMQPNIIAGSAPNSVMPTGLMYPIATPTQTGTHPPSFSWPAVSGAGTGISYTVYRDGVQIASNVNVANYTDPQSAGQTHSYKVAMTNSNGTGPLSPGRSITAT